MQDKRNIEYWIDEENLEWYTRQFDNPYRITVAFEEFLTQNQKIDNVRRRIEIGIKRILNSRLLPT